MSNVSAPPPQKLCQSSSPCASSAKVNASTGAGSARNRFPGMRVLASCIGSITAGLYSFVSSIHSVISSLGSVFWSAHDLLSVKHSNPVVSFSSAENQSVVRDATTKFQQELNRKQELNRASLSIAEDESDTNKIHVWSNTNQTPKISEAFYSDMISDSRTSGLYFLENTNDPLYEKNITDDSLVESQSDDIKQQEKEKKVKAGCQKFVDFVGDEDKAFAISRYATQHYSPQDLISHLGSAGAFFLAVNQNETIQGALLGKSTYYSYTFSKDEKDNISMSVDFKQCPQVFYRLHNGTYSGEVIECDTTSSYLKLNYKINFDFSECPLKPQLKVSDVTYNCRFQAMSSGVL